MTYTFKDYLDKLLEFYQQSPSKNKLGEDDEDFEGVKAEQIPATSAGIKYIYENIG